MGGGRTFQTRQPQDARGFVRTFGTVVDTGPGPLSFGETQAIANAARVAPPGCARGKVAALAHGDVVCEAVCYQMSDCFTRARVVGCCNATAAAAALGAGPRRRVTTILLAVPGSHAVRVEARVLDRRGETVVRQRWTDVPFSVQREVRIGARMCAACVGPFNDYLVVRAAAGERIDEIGPDEAEHLRSSLRPLADPLRARIVFVEAARGGLSRVKFFTCGTRAHPSAPLTGLAVLALAAATTPWIDLAAGKRVATPAGLMPLPRVRLHGGNTVSVAFPPVVVRLEPAGAPAMVTA